MEPVGNKNGFSVIVSLDPPKGTDTEALEKNAERLKGRVDAVLVNDSIDAVMRMTPPAACSKLLSRGVRPILGMNNRDRNRLAVQGDLLGAWALGIRDVVFEDGKDPSFGDHPLTKPIYDLTGIALVEAVAELNQGRDLAAQSLKGRTDFFFGAWVEWLDDDRQLDQEFNKMEAMAQKGAMAFFTSPQFDVERTKKLLARAAPLGAPVYVGAMLLKSVGMARYLNEVPGVSRVPDSVIRKLAEAPVKAKAGVGIAVEFIKELQGAAAGVVLMPIGWEHKAPEILEGIGR